MTDDLLQRARRGEIDALEAICEREWRPVYGIVYRAVGNVSEAQDLTQETFIRALRSFDRFRGDQRAFRAYLGTIARNLVRDRWRRRGLQQVAMDEAAQIPSTRPGPEERAMGGVDAETLRTAMATLPESYRTVLWLRIVEGRPAKEVATMVGRSPGAVRQIQHRALVQLRSKMREESRS